MKNILLVLSSPRGWKSHSHQFASHIVDDLKARHPGAKVVVRDVAKEPLPHVGEAFGTGRVLPLEKRNPAEAKALALSDALVDELVAADVVVLAAPMYNFGLPSSLKAWIDHIVRPGRTFSYSEKGPEGRCGRARRCLFRRARETARLPGVLPSRRPRIHRHHERACGARRRRGDGRRGPQERDGVRQGAIGRSGTRVRVTQNSNGDRS